ncbi:MAG: PIN domain-containing protein [Patescibacteria group bacterium]
MILLDSNIVIGYLNGDQHIVDTLDALVRNRVALFISPVSIAEALCLPDATGEKLATIEEFLDGFIVIDPDTAIAKLAASLRRSYKLDIPDAFIVATAMERSIPLATRDKKMRIVRGVIFADI